MLTSCNSGDDEETEEYDEDEDDEDEDVTGLMDEVSSAAGLVMWYEVVVIGSRADVSGFISR